MKPAFKLVSMIWSMTLVASVAAGQQKGYVQAGVLATEQPAGTPNHRVLPAISGSTVGVAAAVGFFVTPKVAIEGELVASRPISTPQRFSYDWFEDFTGESRDMFLGANVRWAARRHLEFVGGAALVFATAAERSILRTDLPFPGRPNGPQSEPDQHAGGDVGGPGRDRQRGHDPGQQAPHGRHVSGIRGFLRSQRPADRGKVSR